jgi:pyruvate dehydrogenase E1 component alpha subunit
MKIIAQGTSAIELLSIGRDRVREMLYRMMLTRAFEDKVAWLFSRAMIHGTTHLSVGQEAAAIGATAALEPDDVITSTHRGHGHCIGKGVDVNAMMAEMLGRASGICKGKGGSMHIADLGRGNLGANGVVGGGLAIAAGAALAIRMKRQDRVVLCFFGDGALNQGVFHESINLASVWKLPVIYFCENNTYGMSMHVSRSINLGDLAERARAYGIPGISIDGNDVFEVYEQVKEARAHVHSDGPVLVVANTYRTRGHSKSDANRYRTREEIAEWEARCPIKRARARVVGEEVFSEAELDVLQAEAEAAIARAVELGQASPPPSIDTVLDDVYAGQADA